MVTVYGNKCFKSFCEGRQTTSGQPRPGQTNKVITNDSIASVNEMIQANRRVATREISHELNWVKDGSHHYPPTSGVQQSVCGMGTKIPDSWSSETTNELLSPALDPLWGESCISGSYCCSDDTWCHHYTPKSEKTSMQWKHSSSPPPRKSKATITARKVMLSIFFDCRGPLLIEFLPQGSTINSAQYCSTLTKLRKAIKNKRLGLLSQGVILLHDNTHPYVSQET